MSGERCDAGADAGADGDADGDSDADADGDADRYAAIAAAYEAERIANDVPGLAVAIVEDGEIAWSQGFGSKARGSDEPVTPDTQFRCLGVENLQNIALLQLVDAGEVDLEDLLIDHVAELDLTEEGPLGAAQRSAVESITVRQLLLNTSGLEGGTQEPTTWPDHADTVLDEFLTSPEFADSHHMAAPPGEVLHPSNIAAALIGLIVERAVSAREGQFVPFAEHMRGLLDDLGMTRTTYRAEEVEELGDYATADSILEQSGPTDLDNPWMRPVFGVWSTAHDLAVFAQFLAYGNDAVLSKERLDAFLEMDLDHPGWNRLHTGALGVGTSEGPCVVGGICPAQGELRVHWGTGFFSGTWQTALTVVPSRDFAVAYVSNGPFLFPQADELALTTLLELPPLVADRPGDDHDPLVYVGRYVLDSGATTQITYDEDEGTLRASSPGCELVPIAPGNFGCDADKSVWFYFDEDDQVEYMVVPGSFVAVPDPTDTQ